MRRSWTPAAAIGAIGLSIGCAAQTITATPAPMASEPSRTRPESVVEGFGITITDLSDSTLDAAAGAGFAIVRFDLQWSEVERIEGEFNWSTYDRVVAGLTARGLRPLFIIDFNNPLYTPTGDYMDGVDTPKELEGYARFAAAAVERYGSSNPIWELYNEPNRRQFWRTPDPLLYVEMVTAAASAMRAIDPAAYLIGPALGHDQNSNDDLVDKLDYDFLEATLEAGLLESVDAVSIHPYPDDAPERVLEIYAKARALVAEFAPAGREYPIISSEWGYSSAAAVSSDAQVRADYWTRMYLINVAAGIPVSIGFKLEYSTLDPSLDDYELGFPLIDADGRPQAALTQVQSMIASLDGFAFDRRLDSRAEDYVLQFKRGSSVAIALWTTGPPHEIDVDGTRYALTGTPIIVTRP